MHHKHFPHVWTLPYSFTMPSNISNTGNKKLNKQANFLDLQEETQCCVFAGKTQYKKKQHRDKITLHSLPVLYIYTQNIHYWISINLYPGYYYRYYSTWYEYGTMNNVSPQNTPFTWKLVYEIVIQVILLKEISLLPTAC